MAEIIKVHGILHQLVGKKVKLDVYEDDFLTIGSPEAANKEVIVNAVADSMITVTLCKPKKGTEAEPLAVAIASIKRIEIIEEAE